MSDDITKVIFRKFKDTGDIIALFPEEPHSYRHYTFESYMHIGQHAEASEQVVWQTVLATPEEYADLKSELEAEPYHYKLDIRQRITTQMREERERRAKKYREK